MSDKTPEVNKPEPSIREAQRFLEALDPDREIWTFQTIDDSTEKQRSLTRTFHGSLEAYASELIRLNSFGAGIHVLVNRGDGKGRKKANIKAVTHLFVDLDGAPLEPLRPAHPGIIVESSPGRYHAYWPVTGCKLELFSDLQKALAEKFSGDPQVHDLPRVMRLPGFLHQKGEPFLTNIIEIHKRRPLTASNPPPRAERKGRTARPHTHTVGVTIPEGRRNTWLTRRGGVLRCHGEAYEAIRDSLLDYNERCCNPPLPASDVQLIAKSVARYEPGHALPADLNLPEDLKGLRLPPGYKITAAGIIDSKGNVACGSPLLVSQRLRCVETHSIQFELKFAEGESWEAIRAGREICLDRRHIVGLTKQGLPISSGEAALCVGYLAGFERINRGRLPYRLSSSRLGWRHADSFLWGGAQIAPEGAEPISFNPVDTGNRQLARGYHSRGSLSQWCEAIAPAARYARARLALYAAFAAPLLRILAVPNVGVDFSGRTSTGKTTLLRLAASVWGNPDESAPDSCVRNWDLKLVGLERAAALQTDLPLILDDTKRGMPKQIGQLLYSIIQGQGRARGKPGEGAIAHTAHWRTILISSGEAAAVSYTQDAGARARILTVRGMPFGSGSNAELVDKLNSDLLGAYGSAGPEFVRMLIAHREDRPTYRARFEGLADGFDAQSAVENRKARAAAVILFAGQLAHEFLHLPFPFQNPFTELWPEIQAESAETHIDIRAVRELIAWAQANRDHFFPGGDRPPAGGWLGINTPGEIGIRPDVLRKWCADNGYDEGAVVSGWKERGLLTTGAGLSTVKRRFDGKRVRLYCLKCSEIEDFD